MDLSVSLAARDSSQGLGPVFGLNGLPRPAPPKATKKPKKAVLFFEVEILDAKTREKLCFLDKVEPQATIAEIKNLFTKTRTPLQGFQKDNIPLFLCFRSVSRSHTGAQRSPPGRVP